MNLALLTPEVQEFILENLQSNLSKLILKGSPFTSVSIQEIANQIIGKQKAQKKLPTWFETKGIYYPPKENLEQTSSEMTAHYKSTLVKGKNCIDLTGGFGVDSYFLSKKFDSVTHCELNEELSQIAKHNYAKLNVPHIECFLGDGINYLKKRNQKFDCVYADPSRRDAHRNRVFLLEDCIPNIPESLETILMYTDTLLLKFSPMLDIQIGIDQLQFVKEVHVVAVENEVKELVFLIKKGYEGEVFMKTINVKKNQIESFDFVRNEASEVTYSEPLKYLYEPNKALLKSGGFRMISERYKLAKLHVDSHLFTSSKQVPFPGRVFNIINSYPFDKKSKKSLLKTQANITTRNFPLSVKEIKKTLKINDGGDRYLFFTTNTNGKRIVIEAKKTESN